MDPFYFFILVLASTESQDLLSLALSLLSTKQKCIVAGLCTILLLPQIIAPKEPIETKPRVFLTAETNYEHYERRLPFQILKQAKLQSVMPAC